jgi:hypothetical protein
MPMVNYHDKVLGTYLALGLYPNSFRMPRITSGTQEDFSLHISQ